MTEIPSHFSNFLSLCIAWEIYMSVIGFQVCDQPHPLHVKNMVRNVLEGKFDEACSGLKQLYDLGYSPTDIITTLFRIIKNYDMAEYLKLEFMKVRIPC
jgi:DNA polymerase III delta prime subunit